MPNPQPPLRARAALLAAALSGSLLAAAPTAALTVPDDMAQRMQACVVCHGKEGRATNHGFFPRIAGKPAGYLFNQLNNFREGRRLNSTMTYLVDHMSEAYLHEIAGYFAGLDLPYPPPQTTGAPPALLARGEQLVRQGDPQRGIPACSQCHGTAMTGVNPAMPGLLGLPRDYILAQFGAWRTGERRAAAPDCMAEIARRLSLEDVTAAAAWLSSQPVTSGPAPAGSLAPKLPLDCGSGLR
ncbi:cytochrome c4 [Ramlibacter sp.]|uniref:c-type cytochrome n=1 Tax=Ramlibacter sp. TaxID=1917967 RepID=UPI002D5F99E6|nr:cytochrome c4 [Ramlibacter sp.]HYD75861.1 cytochrome c4 [Ramlibacter sp.]